MVESRYSANSSYDCGFICNGSLLVDRWVHCESAFNFLDRYKPEVCSIVYPLNGGVGNA